MTAITSQTFHHSSPSLGLGRAAAVLVAGGRLLARAFVSPAASATATVRSRAREAQEVRELARTWQRTDPGFAADLYAAAARHEGLDD